MAHDPHARDAALEVDLDEDLFGFDRLDAGRAREESDDLDLDEIFAVIEESEGEDQELEEEDDEPPPRAAPAAAAAPARRAPSADAAADPGGHARGGAEPWSEPDEGAHDQDATHEDAANSAARPRSRAQRGEEPEPRPRPSFARTNALLLAALTALNGLVALVVLRTSGEVQSSVWEGVRQVAETAEGIRSGTLARYDEFQATHLPLAALSPDDHPTFALVREDLEAGRWAGARQRLYSLLAVVDRMEPRVRDEVEARAIYGIAEATHLEALARGGPSQ